MGIVRRNKRLLYVRDVIESYLFCCCCYVTILFWYCLNTIEASNTHKTNDSTHGQPDPPIRASQSKAFTKHSVTAGCKIEHDLENEQNRHAIQRGDRTQTEQWTTPTNRLTYRSSSTNNNSTQKRSEVVTCAGQAFHHSPLTENNTQAIHLSINRPTKSIRTFTRYSPVLLLSDPL